MNSQRFAECIFRSGHIPLLREQLAEIAQRSGFTAFVSDFLAKLERLTKKLGGACEISLQSEIRCQVVTRIGDVVFVSGALKESERFRAKFSPAFYVSGVG